MIKLISTSEVRGASEHDEHVLVLVPEGLREVVCQKRETK